MGADQFFTRGEGKTAREAFAAAQERARYEYGHRGYTGTIAEKHSFVMIPRVDGETPFATVNRLFDARDRRIDDKFGPAGCIELGDGAWLFFGWASS